MTGITLFKNNYSEITWNRMSDKIGFNPDYDYVIIGVEVIEQGMYEKKNDYEKFCDNQVCAVCKYKEYRTDCEEEFYKDTEEKENENG